VVVFVRNVIEVNYVKMGGVYRASFMERDSVQQYSGGRVLRLVTWSHLAQKCDHVTRLSTRPPGYFFMGSCRRADDERMRFWHLADVERRLLTNELTEGWEVAVDRRCVK
jgi:hypothetical protein